MHMAIEKWNRFLRSVLLRGGDLNAVQIWCGWVHVICMNVPCGVIPVSLRGKRLLTVPGTL